MNEPNEKNETNDMKVKQILQQSPEGISEEEIKQQLEEHDGDSVKVLSILWEVNSNTDDGNHQKEQNDKQKKWENIRDICNSYEQEMQDFMNSKRN